MNYKEIKELQKFISLEIEDLYCLFLVKKHALACTDALPYMYLLAAVSSLYDADHDMYNVLYICILIN